MCLIYNYLYVHKVCERWKLHLKHNWSVDVCLDSVALEIIPSK